MNHLAVAILVALVAASLSVPAHSADPAPAIEIPGDGDVPLEDRLDSVEVDRDILFQTGFDARTARAHALAKAGRIAEAEALYRLIVTEELAAADRDDRFLAWAEGNLGGALADQQRNGEAEEILRRAYARVEWRPESERSLYQITCNLGGLLTSQGRFAEAEPMLRRAVKETSRRNFRGTVYALHSQLSLAYTLFAQEKSGELAPLLVSIDTQIGRFNYAGSEFETRLRRLQCLASGQCKIGTSELWAEVSRAMAPAVADAS